METKESLYTDLEDLYELFSLGKEAMSFMPAEDKFYREDWSIDLSEKEKLNELIEKLSVLPGVWVTHDWVGLAADFDWIFITVEYTGNIF